MRIGKVKRFENDEDKEQLQQRWGIGNWNNISLEKRIVYVKDGFVTIKDGEKVQHVLTGPRRSGEAGAKERQGDRELQPGKAKIVKG